ncbi:ABC transporter substrate-binding protein [Paenibacillus soyae]|uniref:ABC transporter substrate-binding protein n=1 Tax=Paenibacillus soyae TaxID=2969249 RepID=A0A9X2SB82_9BACL|nr:ABC transporter substrate-binding protein [Paenibacillus soyae]MCR2807021.1 ABC transporter substrate-binding protein [Paenibacillus soyae]
MRRTMMIILSVVIAAALSGCNGNAAAPATEEIVETEDKTALSMEPVELELWAYYDGWSSIIESFEEKYPNVTVKLKTFAFDTYADVYKEAIASGETPDVMLTDSEHFGQFTTIAGLENLLDYGAGEYEKDISGSLWASNFSFDGQSMVGFPFGSSPIVAYYREDMMRQYGFPSDPEELGKYMEDPDNWLEIARTLKKDGRYLAQWSTEVIRVYDSAHGLLDENVSFLRNNEAYYEAIELAKTLNEEGLVSLQDVWTEAGAQTVRDGELAMLYQGTWGASQIEAWAPDTAGHWRATRLPFNKYGWANSASFMIPTASDQKAWAWELIRYIVTDWAFKGVDNSVPAYIPARANGRKLAETSDFFGGQKMYATNLWLTENMKEYRLTPLDQQVKQIWNDTVNKGIERQKDAETIIQEAEQMIQTSLGDDIEILRSIAQENR